MGDIKKAEAFLDAVMIRITATGAAALGLAPTSILTKLTTGARVGLTVVEVGNGIYKVTDMAPADDDEYMTEWAVAGAYTIYQAFKLFKVGGGDVQDIFDLVKAAGAGDVAAILTDTSAIVWGDITTIDTLIDGIVTDLGVFPTANYATMAAYVEDIRTRLIAIVADTGTIVWGDITGIVNDIGVFPTANYATLAAYVEDIRARFIALNDVSTAQVNTEVDTGLSDIDLDHLIKVAHPTGDPVADTLIDLIMNKGAGQTYNRATDSLEFLGERIASIYTAAITAIPATLVTIGNFVDDLEIRLTALRAGYLDELAAANIPADIDGLKTDVEEAHERAFLRRYPFVTTNESVANAAEISLAAPAVVTPTFPTGATRLNSYVVAILKANNQSAAGHAIGVTLQRNIAAGGWVDLRDLTANEPLTLPAVDNTADSITLIEPIAITTGQSIQFRFQVDSDDAGEVHYTQTFIYVLEYDFQ